MVDAGRPWTTDDASAARVRFQAREQRLARGERIERRGVVARPVDAARQRQRTVAEALDRARARRGAIDPRPK